MYLLKDVTFLAICYQMLRSERKCCAHPSQTMRVASIFQKRLLKEECYVILFGSPEALVFFVD